MGPSRSARRRDRTRRRADGPPQARWGRRVRVWAPRRGESVTGRRRRSPRPRRGRTGTEPSPRRQHSHTGLPPAEGWEVEQSRWRCRAARSPARRARLRRPASGPPGRASGAGGGPARRRRRRRPSAPAPEDGLAEPVGVAELDDLVPQAAKPVDDERRSRAPWRRRRGACRCGTRRDCSRGRRRSPSRRRAMVPRGPARHGPIEPWTWPRTVSATLRRKEVAPSPVTPARRPPAAPAHAASALAAIPFDGRAAGRLLVALVARHRGPAGAALAATTLAPRVQRRRPADRPSTSAPLKVRISTSTRVVAVATVAGGRWQHGVRGLVQVRDQLVPDLVDRQPDRQVAVRRHVSLRRPSLFKSVTVSTTL